MTVASFVPELWAAAIQEPYEKSLVYAQAGVVHSDFSSSVSQMGDKLHINTLSAPTIKDYDKAADLEVEDLTTAGDVLTIDQASYFNFRAADVDRAQAAGDLHSPATRQAGIGLRDKVDKYIAGIIKDGATAKLGTLTVVDDDPRLASGAQITAFKALAKMAEKLNANSVPVEGRYVVVGPKTYSALLMDPRFTKADASGTSEGLRNGLVGRAIGFDVLISNNVPVTASRELAVAGVPGAVAFASQIVETEAIRDQHRFGDLIRGLNLYGAKVIRPEGLVTADLDVKAPVVAGG